MANKVRINPGRLVQTLIRPGGPVWLRSHLESTLMNSGAPQETVNAIMTRCAPLHHAASHPCSSIQASQCCRNQNYETRTSQAFMSTNSEVSPPTQSTREKVPEGKDSGIQAVERTIKERKKQADEDKKLNDEKARLPSAKVDEDMTP